MPTDADPLQTDEGRPTEQNLVGPILINGANDAQTSDLCSDREILCVVSSADG